MEYIMNKLENLICNGELDRMRLVIERLNEILELQDNKQEGIMKKNKTVPVLRDYNILLSQII